MIIQQAKSAATVTAGMVMSLLGVMLLRTTAHEKPSTLVCWLAGLRLHNGSSWSSRCELLLALTAVQ